MASRALGCIFCPSGPSDAGAAAEVVTEADDEAVADSGLVGFLTAPSKSRLAGVIQFTSLQKYREREAWKICRLLTFEIILPLGLELLTPAPDRIEDQAHGHAAADFELQ